jgi:hypothetical protein
MLAGAAAVMPGSYSSSAHAATSPIYWGSYQDGAPFNPTQIDQFESDAGKREAIVHWGSPWQMNGAWMPFQTPQFETVRLRGSIPMIDWNSWNLGAPVNDPNYTLAKVYNGTYDSYITQWAQSAKAWGHPFFLRFDHEMNGWWQFPWAEQLNGNQPGDYVKAWRHVHDIFTQQGATNVTWVWCVNVVSANTTPVTELYPGDNYVDWTSMDGYNKATDSTNWLTSTQVFGDNPWSHQNTYQQLVTLAPSKPIMIAETATTLSGGDPGGWASDTLLTQLPQNFPQVKALVWFNWNASDPAETWPIESSPSLQAGFKLGVASSYYATNTFANLPPGSIQPLGASLPATPVPPTAIVAVPPTATTVPPTATPVPPTATAVPPTVTPVPPTATAVPPTATAVPPTATAVPPTATSVPPTATPVPPTATSVPPTATSVPPTATSVPPTATSVPPTAAPVVTAPAPSAWQIRVGAGGRAYTSADNRTWEADTAYSGGSVFASTAAIGSTLDPALYQKERYGNFAYNFSVPNGTYTVDLKFAELYWTSAGKRVFNVAINQQPALTNFDILAQPNTPANTALDKMFTTTVTNGTLNIAFSGVVDYAQVNAIEIVPGTLTRINAGGPASTGSNNGVWQADTAFTGGTAWGRSANVAKTVDQSAYQSMRYGNFSYNVAVPNGSYRVVLKFAELYWTSAGKRVFNVAINQQPALTNFDILAQPSTGPNTALDKTFQVTVTNGNINIAFSTFLDNAQVNAIEILPGR